MVMEAAVQPRRERGFVRERVVPVVVLAALMALLDGEPYTLRELLADPASLPFLAALYLAYAVTVQFVVARFLLTPRTAMLFGCFVGVVLEGFFHRTFYADEPLVAGVNWITVLVMLAYWGVLTTGLAFYATSRLTPRELPAPPRAGGWIALAAAWTLILGVWGANLPPLREPGALPAALLAIALLAAFVALARRPAEDGRTLADVGPRRGLDVAIGAYIALELLAVVLVPATAVRVVMWIVTGTVLGIVGLVVLGRRTSTGRTAPREEARA